MFRLIRYSCKVPSFEALAASSALLNKLSVESEDKYPIFLYFAFFGR